MPLSDQHPQLPVPEFYSPEKVGEIWNVPYQERAEQAVHWAHTHQIQPASADRFRIALIAIDVQNTFCIPGFELFVAGKSGNGAVEDNQRLCEFIYHNLNQITKITATLDTHLAMQIFHPVFLINEKGEHPAPLTLISYDDLQQGVWKFNPAIAESLDIDEEYGQRHLEHYAAELRAQDKYDLTIWPYHVMLGSVGHALVPSVEEAIFFHTIARSSQAEFKIKGNNPLTEHYSAIGPEVLVGHTGERIAQKSEHLVRKLMDFVIVIIAGQAKSHCMAWTIDDLMEGVWEYDRNLIGKIYLLEDCTSPVVVPGVIDYSEQADQAYERFAGAGMHVVRSTEPIQSWPGIPA